jgi:hypothetical protein
MAVVLLAVVTMGVPSALHAETGSPQTYSFDTSELDVRNLIGEITVAGHGGSSFEVVVTFHGKDAADGGMTVVREDEGDRGQLVVQFPTERGKYVYPRLGKNSSTSFSPGSSEDRGWLSEVIGSLFGGKVTVRGSGSGREMWADIEIRVPSGASLNVRHGVGELRASGVDGDLDMESRSGLVSTDQVRGDVSVATGSGRVEVAQIDGLLQASTGSGRIKAREIRGSTVTIATGSGGVELEQVDASTLTVATGSGRVEPIAPEADGAG